jgi:hypothetical protein
VAVEVNRNLNAVLCKICFSTLPCVLHLLESLNTSKSVPVSGLHIYVYDTSY